MRNQGVPLVSGDVITVSGDCATGDGVRYWAVRNKKGGHEQESSSTPTPATRGAVSCHHDRNLSWIEWTDDRLNVFSVATGRDPIPLYAWWRPPADPPHSRAS